MITINVLLKAKPEKEQEYLEYVANLVEKSRADEGCLFYDHVKSLTAPNVYMIIENWTDDAAIEKHNETEHLKNFLENISEYVTEDPVLKLSRD